MVKCWLTMKYRQSMCLCVPVRASVWESIKWNALRNVKLNDA